MKLFNNSASRLNINLPNGEPLVVNPGQLSQTVAFEVQFIQTLITAKTPKQLAFVLDSAQEHSLLGQIPVSKEYVLPEGVPATVEGIDKYLNTEAEEVNVSGSQHDADDLQDYDPEDEDEEVEKVDEISDEEFEKIKDYISQDETYEGIPNGLILECIEYSGTSANVDQVKSKLRANGYTNVID